MNYTLDYYKIAYMKRSRQQTQSSLIKRAKLDSLSDLPSADIVRQAEFAAMNNFRQMSSKNDNKLLTELLKIGSNKDKEEPAGDMEEPTGLRLFNPETGITTRGNRIYFRADITEDSIAELIKVIDRKNDDYKRMLATNKSIKDATPNPLWLHITSYGGSVLAGMRAYDTIRRSAIPILSLIHI